MQTAIVCMATGQGEPRSVDGEITPSAAAAEAMQAIALAKALPGPAHATLICPKDSLLFHAAADADLPHLALGSGMVDKIRLWNWQRKHARLWIICVGEKALKTGGMLFSLGKRGSRQIDSLFLLESPRNPSLRSLEASRHIICGSQYIANTLRSRLFRAKDPVPQIHMAAPGISLADYQFPRKSSRRKRLILGMDNSLMPDSGALLVIRAMAALWQDTSFPPWEVRMYGSGPRFDEVIAEAEKMGVQSRLSILGDQPLSEASALCDLWLAPGVTPSEPPQTLWAGFAAGIPVILSRSILHEERTWHNKAGLAVSSGNPQELARAILDVMRDAALNIRLSEASAAMRPLISLKGMARRVTDILGLDQPEMASPPAAAKE